MSASEYLLAGQVSELERLKLQSRVWEPSGRRLLGEIGDGRGARAVDIGCGVVGWLRVLSEWVGPDGQVVGTDIDDAMLAVANEFVAEERLGNVQLVKDDLFASCLEPASFDLVHARYEITPLGRGPEQMTTYLQLVRPAGTVVLEDPDVASWHFNPPAPALQKLITLIVEAFRRTGVDPRRTLFVGDRADIDVVGAQAMGMDVAWINPGHEALPAGIAPPTYEIRDLAELDAITG